MNMPAKRTIASCLVATLILLGAAWAFADGDEGDVGYGVYGPLMGPDGVPMMATPYGVVPMTGGGPFPGIGPVIINSADGNANYIIQQQEESAFDRRERETFHPGYYSWSDYYADPPWMHQDDSDFHPYWLGR